MTPHALLHTDFTINRHLMTSPKLITDPYAPVRADLICHRAVPIDGLAHGLRDV